MAQSIELQTCDVCGKKFVTGYGYSIAACWLVTGSAFVTSYMCDQTEINQQQNINAPQTSGQHWGCTPEHAMEALMKCLQEHMHVDNLKKRHLEKHTRKIVKTNDDGTTEETQTIIPRYSKEDELWAKARYDKFGDNFHIVDFSL